MDGVDEVVDGHRVTAHRAVLRLARRQSVVGVLRDAVLAESVTANLKWALDAAYNDRT